MKGGLIALALLWIWPCHSPAQSVNGPGDDVLCSAYTPVQLRPARDQRGIPDRKFQQPLLFPAVTGKPYSARRAVQDLQIRGDGMRLCSVPMVTVYYRDSAGRIREETEFSLEGPDGKPAPFRVKIVDPGQPIEYDLDMATQTVYRLHPQKPPQPANGVHSVSEPSNPSIQYKTESLGTHPYQGVDVEGSLTTTTGIPPGSTTPISAAQELWIWPYIHSPVLTKSVNPVSSRTDAWLRISTAEPDPALFRIPDGWKIVDAVIAPPGGSGSASRTSGGFQYTSRIVPRRTDFVVVEAPYSAVQSVENASNLALKLPAVTTSTKMYRDSSGRTRVERSLLSP